MGKVHCELRGQGLEGFRVNAWSDREVSTGECCYLFTKYAGSKEI